MRVLLDTHALLWWLTDDAALSDRARGVIGDPDTVAFVSAASVWEIGVKAAAGRLEIAGDVDLPAALSEAGFLDLPLSARHAWEASRLPAHHADPFDRMLIAQARSERLVCITRDPAFAAYDGTPLLW